MLKTRCDIHHDLYYFWMKIFRRNGILKHDWTKKKIREKWKDPTKGRREQYSGEREGNLLMREKTRMEKIELFLLIIEINVHPLFVIV